MTPLFILLAFVLFAQRVAHRNYQFAVPKLPFIAFIHLLIWAGLSVFWSFDQALSARLLLPLLALFAMGVFALDEVKSTAKLQSDGLKKALIVGAGLAIALLFFESVTGSWLTRQGRGMPWYEAYWPCTWKTVSPNGSLTLCKARTTRLSSSRRSESAS